MSVEKLYNLLAFIWVKLIFCGLEATKVEIEGIQSGLLIAG